MSRVNQRPVILALSNPTEHAECTPEQAYNWSKGKAIYAAGVQVPPVRYNGRTFLPGQANNFFIFPAVGMAIFATQAKRVTDQMCIESKQAVTPIWCRQNILSRDFFTRFSQIFLMPRLRLQRAVAKLIFDGGLAQVPRPANMLTFIRQHVYKPEYTNATPAPAPKKPVSRAKPGPVLARRPRFSPVGNGARLK